MPSIIPPIIPAAHPYYYPPAYMQHAPHGVPEAQPESNAEVEPKLGERSLETDEPSQGSPNSFIKMTPYPALICHRHYLHGQGDCRIVQVTRS